MAAGWSVSETRNDQTHIGGRAGIKGPPGSELVYYNHQKRSLLPEKDTLCLDLHCMLGIQFALSTQVGEELTTWDVLHQEEEVAVVLRESL